MPFDAELLLDSCTIRGFQTGISVGSGVNLTIERSHISDCKGNAVILKSPLEAYIIGSTIEHCDKNGIIIHAKTGVNHNTTDIVSIEGSEINSNMCDGISVIGSDNKKKLLGLHPQSTLAISVMRSRIRSNKKSGIFVSNSSVRCVQILQSDIGGNSESNILLKNVKAGDSDAQRKGLTCLGIISSRIFDSQLGNGVELSDCSSVLLENNEIYRNKIFGVIAYG